MAESAASSMPVGLFGDLNFTVLPLDCSTPALNLCVRDVSPNSEMPRTPKPGKLIPLSPDTSARSPSSDSSIASEFYHDFNAFPLSPEVCLKNNKNTRPFKAYPKNPLSLSESVLGQHSSDEYADFRRRMLAQVQTRNPAGITNAKMRRTSITSTAQEGGKDAAYWERRRKNNEAAKRSRDARRAKEDEIAIRAAFLEQENLKLKFELAAIKSEANRLRCLLYN